jgi:hypothetical protein
MDMLLTAPDAGLLTYTEHLYRHTDPLPPPARVILLYALLGWGREQGGDCLPGWRSLPDRRAWVPAFIRMIGEPDRLARLCAYSLAGLRYERAPVELLATVERAFALPGFDRMMIEAMAEQSIR